MEPQNTLRRRVEESAHDYGSVDTCVGDEVPSCWCDTEKVHVYLYNIGIGPGEYHFIQ